VQISNFQAGCLVIAAVAFGMLVAGPNPITPESQPQNGTTSPTSHSTETLLPPCPEEDSPNCYWDASERGNGLGHDVVNP